MWQEIIRDSLDRSLEDAEKEEHKKGDPLHMLLRVEPEDAEEQAACLCGVVIWANEHRPWTSFKLIVETKIEPWTRGDLHGEVWYTSIELVFEGWGVEQTVEPETVSVS